MPIIESFMAIFAPKYPELRYLTPAEIKTLENTSWACPICFEPPQGRPIICHDLRHPIHKDCELRALPNSNGRCSVCQAQVRANNLSPRQVQYPIDEVQSPIDMDAFWACAATIADTVKIPFVQISAFALGVVFAGYWRNDPLLIGAGLLIEAGGIWAAQKEFEDKGTIAPVVSGHLRGRLSALTQQRADKYKEIQDLQNQLEKEREFIENIGRYREKLPESSRALENTRKMAALLAVSLRQREIELRELDQQLSVLEPEYAGLENNPEITFHRNMYSMCKAAKCAVAFAAAYFAWPSGT